MKKLLTIAIVASWVLVSVGCGDSNTKSTVVKDSASKASTEVKEKPADKPADKKD